MIRRLYPLLGALVFVLGGLPANADLVTVSNSTGFVTSTPGATTFWDFDSNDNTSIGTVTGAIINQGGSSTPNGGGNYGSTSGGPITVTLAHPASYVGFLWGTMDGYNQVLVFDGVDQIDSVAGNTDGLGTGFVNFTASPGESITSLVLTSGGCCFEVDNFAAIEPAAATPEPSTWLIVPTGFGMLSLLGLKVSRTARV